MPVVETALYTRDGLWIFCEYLQDLLVIVMKNKPHSLIEAVFADS